ncbi:hypothetical protein NLJ89_g6375 [Agrocybe chaxingu]|uniref:Uncharacterized protein n=1 Tax=Agrocybe chaxingu TaxID=84603 RepID=A0A9W8JYR8_9AGAR|nr:hypothetical protein NLJ89_g6375 [Agrocybe chaxingu]
MPSLVPRIPKGSGQDLILITMTEAKKLYCLKDEQMRNIKVYRVEKAIFNLEPVLVHYYRDDLVEFEAWKALLQRKRAYDKRPQLTAAKDCPLKIHLKNANADQGLSSFFFLFILFKAEGGQKTTASDNEHDNGNILVIALAKPRSSVANRKANVNASSSPHSS